VPPEPESVAAGGSAVHGWPAQGFTRVVEVVEVLVVEVEVLLVDVLVLLVVDELLVVVCAVAVADTPQIRTAMSTPSVRLVMCPPPVRRNQSRS
jgi:hypothetical protein